MCLWKHALPLVISHVSSSYFVQTSSIVTNVFFFLCTLFPALVPSPAENNYSLFVRRCDEGRATQTPASFYRFRGRHVAQEERRSGGDDSRTDDNANYSVSYYMSFKPTTSHKKGAVCLTHTHTRAHAGTLYPIVCLLQTAGITVCPN